MSERIVKFHHDERGIVKTWDELGELIRCKDCKFYDSGFCCNEKIESFLDYYADYIDFEFKMFFCPPEDFYCPYGKGKEERK